MMISIEPVDVRAGLAAVALQQRPRLERFEHPAGQRLVQRRQAQGAVAEHLGRRPPIPTMITEPNWGPSARPMISSKLFG